MSTTSSWKACLWSLKPGEYEPHSVHRAGPTYLETNCYADVLIELLHARGDEPLAALGSIVRTDWEGDQFTYAKPRYADLERLFGIDVHEMLPYRPLPEHIAEQLSLGRTVLRRDRRLVPARHRGHQLPARASQDDRRARHDRPGRRADAVLPQRRLL